MRFRIQDLKFTLHYTIGLLFTLVIIRYAFLELQDISVALSSWQFILLALSLTSIMTGTHLINLISKIENGIILKNNFSDSKAYNYYIIYNCIGVGTGFYLSYSIYKPNFAIIFVLLAATGYGYAFYFKKNAIISNILRASWFPINILLLGIFCLLPSITIKTQSTIKTLFQILIDYSSFIFMSTFILSLTDDLKKQKQDALHGISTLATSLGTKKTIILITILSFIPIICTIYYIYTYIFYLNWATYYCILFILGPQFLFTIKGMTAHTIHDFKKLSTLLKVILWLTVIAIAAISLNTTLL